MNFNTLRGKNYGVEHLLATFSGPLEDILQKQLELSAAQVCFLRSFGAIYLNDKRCLENVQVEEGTYLRVHQNPRRFPVEVFNWNEQIIFEDDDLIVLNKPSGLPVPATVDNLHENIAALVSRELGYQAHVTHRLDTGTTGLLILAKHKAAQIFINQKLMHGEIQKFYRALVHGRGVRIGEWVHYMEPSPRAPKIVSPVQKPGSSQCRLKVLDQTEIFHGHTEVIIELITGRTHQIRAQMSSAGYPIVGDVMYGSPVRLAPYEKINLQAFYLSFPTLSGEKKSFRLSAGPWQNQPSVRGQSPLS
jgi:23S rRNA pseudouridine1911/1915/1917 synthase